MTEPIRWGILGTGSIAHTFATGLSLIPDAELAAVGSRSAETAAAFADEFDIPRRHASYEDLAADREIDVIHVSTPHPMHKANSILCLEAGKPVLCEKPFTVNAAEADEVIALARSRGLFLMEAMWTRFLPIVVQVREWLAEGAIGEVSMVVADVGFRAGFDPKSRLFDPQLGGGALLDIGIYPLSFVSMVLGPHPTRIETMATLGETGVDEANATILGYAEGQLALIYSAVRTKTPMETSIAGTEGTIVIHPPYIPCTSATLKAGDREEHLDLRPDGRGLKYQALEVMACLRAGKLESDVMPLDETRGIVAIMDQLRQRWGLKYPME